MRTYEKPAGSGGRGSKYTGLIAVICLFASIFATWAFMRTSPDGVTSPTLTTEMAQGSRPQ
jgi:hypothetical protein